MTGRDHDHPSQFEFRQVSTGQPARVHRRSHPSGKFIYGSNRGHHSIAVFRISDAAKGTLALVEHEPSGGKTPRTFNLTPDGKWLLAANQDSDNITVFTVNQDDGTLTATPHSASVGRPVCIVFLPNK